MQVDINTLWPLVEQKYLTARKHPTHELLIWNYTPKAMYDQHWTPETRMCRGLVTTLEGEVVAKSFDKFFNLEEYDDLLPDEPFTVTEKVDGSLAIVSLYQGELIVATRGSFTSVQAQKAREILERKYKGFPFSVHYTYLFEIVFPANRIVVDYGETEDLVLLATILTKTGMEHSIYEPLWHTEWPFPIAKRYDGIKDIQELEAREEEPNKEGYVLLFESGLRLKCKFSEYKRLHRLLTHTSSKTIWEHLKEGKSLSEIVDRVPPEFVTWVKQQSRTMSQEFNRLYHQSQETYQAIQEQMWIPNGYKGEDILDLKRLERINRAMQQEFHRHCTQFPELAHFLHALHETRGKNHKKILADTIWDSIKPVYTRPFYTDGEEKEVRTHEHEEKEEAPA